MHFMCVCIVLPAILMPTQKVYMRNDESSPTLMCWLAIRRPPLYSTDRIMMLPLRPLWNTHTHTRKTFSRAVWLWQVGYVMSVFFPNNVFSFRNTQMGLCILWPCMENWTTLCYGETSFTHRHVRSGAVVLWQTWNTKAKKQKPLCNASSHNCRFSSPVTSTFQITWPHNG